MQQVFLKGLLLIIMLNATYSFQSYFHTKVRGNVLNFKKINEYEAGSSNQETYIDCLENDKYKMLIANGPAGTGKTLLACQSAIKQLVEGDIDKIIITRPVVPVEEDIGFLPGTINKKMDPWTRPIMDIFNEFQSKNGIKALLKENTIEISPLGFMRGRTFKNSIIIADEMQNCSPNQMLMLLTRIGENSKIVITGDMKQCDKDFSGLQDLLEKLRFYYESEEDMKNDGICLVNLDNSDVMRSRLVSTILDIYNQ